MAAVLAATTALALVVEWSVWLGGLPVPLSETMLWRLGGVVPVGVTWWLARRCSSKNLRALGWLAAPLCAGAMGRASGLTDGMTGTSLTLIFEPVLVIAVTVLPMRPVPALRLAIATAGMFAVAYVAALSASTAAPTLLGPLLLAVFLAPAAAAAVVSLTTRTRGRRRATARRAARLRARLADAERRREELVSELRQATRGPLGNVLSLADKLMEQTLEPEAARSMAQLRSSAETLLAAVDHRLDRERMDETRQPVNSLSFDLHGLLDAVMAQHRPLARIKGLELCAFFDTSLPHWVIGDPSRLRQVISTLVNNAIRWTPRGEVTLHVDDTQRSADDRVMLRFTVQDSGPGLRREDQARVMSDDDAGWDDVELPDGRMAAALGACRDIVGHMGGNLALTSQPGWGTSLAFTVPVDVDVAIERVGPPALRPESDIGTERRSHVLVTDDDPVQREVMTWMMDSRGWTVSTAENGQEALDLMAKQPFDLVLMDVQMPGMDGFTAITEQRQRERVTGGHVIVVALTANAEQSDRQRCLDAGMDGFLPKPVRPEALDATLQHHATSQAAAAHDEREQGRASA